MLCPQLNRVSTKYITLLSLAEWFDLDERSNTKVYVSNLPLDITEQEFVDLMQKCGLVMKDADTNKMKVKLYHEPGDTTVLKGDGLCTYIKVERFLLQYCIILSLLLVIFSSQCNNSFLLCVLERICGFSIKYS